MGTSIIEEAKHTLFGIKLKVGMSPRNRRVRRLRIVAKGHVIFSREPPIRIDNFHQASQVYPFLLQAELLLLGRPRDDGKPHLRYLLRWLPDGNAAVVHIKAASRHIQW